MSEQQGQQRELSAVDPERRDALRATAALLVGMAALLDSGHSDTSGR